MAKLSGKNEVNGMRCVTTHHVVVSSRNSGALDYMSYYTLGTCHRVVIMAKDLFRENV